MKANQNLNIILLGDPAAGKATQSALLVKKHKLFDLDMGRELRRLQNSPGNAQIKKVLSGTLSKGKLTPTKIVRDILHKNIATAPKSKGILFDGTPKMIGEAKLVAKWLNQAGRKQVIVLYLSLPRQEIVRRMLGRKEYFKGKFSKRPDDNTQALQNRIKYYRTNVSEVIEFFSKKYPFKKVSGLGSIKEVQARINQAAVDLWPKAD